MATIANWNGHTFIVSPSLIRSFTDLKIKGACETEDKDTANQKYVELKNGEPAEITMTVSLSAQMGVTSVYTEAMNFVTEATNGTKAYFYMGESKLIPAQMMLIKAEVEEIEHLPNRGDQWISAKVNLTFKQAGGGSGSGGRGTRTSARHSGTESSGGGGAGGSESDTDDYDIQKRKNTVSKGLNTVKLVVAEAKEASGLNDYVGGLLYQAGLIARATQTTADTFTAINPTTQRSPGEANFKYILSK